MQRKNNIVLRLHRQRKPEQVLLPLVREDNGEALRVILEKQDNVTAEFIYRTEKKVRSGWLKLEIEQDGCRRSDNLEEELPDYFGSGNGDPAGGDDRNVSFKRLVDKTGIYQ